MRGHPGRQTAVSTRRVPRSRRGRPTESCPSTSKVTTDSGRFATADGADTICRVPDAPHTAPAGSAAHPPKLYNAFAAVEDALTGAWFWVRRHLGLGRPRQVLPYFGYANDRVALLSGRVLANRLRGGPRAANHWWADVF